MPRPSLVLTLGFCILLGACSVEHPAVSNSVYNPGPEAININTASSEELQAIPHIGEKVAQKIIHHRETNGPFRRPEHLMLIPGISDERFRKIRPLVRVE